MWAPSEVVRENRRRANAIWVCLVIVWISYGMWIIVMAAKKLQNPATSASVEVEAFSFPDIEFCFFPGSGCETTNTSACSSLVGLADIFVSETFNKGGDFKLPALTPLDKEDFPTECRSIELSSLSPSAKILNSRSTPRSLEIWLQVFWVLNSHTGDVPDYENAVNVYFTDLSQDVELRLSESSIGALPYTRLEANTLINTYQINQVEIEMTEYKPLRDATSRVYSAGNIITNEYHGSEGFSSGNETLALLEIGFRENNLSYQKIEEVNPLDFASIFGSLGGFWQYILIAWGFFFVLKEPENKMKIARRLGKLEEHLVWLKGEKDHGEVKIIPRRDKSLPKIVPGNDEGLEDRPVSQWGKPLSSHNVHSNSMAEV